MIEESKPATATVRVFGLDANEQPFSALHAALATSPRQVRLLACCVHLRPGSVIGMQYESRKARMSVEQVVLGPSSEQHTVDLSYLACEPVLPLPGCIPKTSGRERRQFARLTCDLGAKISDGNRDLHVRCTDISIGGCYLQTWTPYKIGTPITISIWHQQHRVDLSGEVRTSDPGVGMGVKVTRTNGEQDWLNLLNGLKPRT